MTETAAQNQAQNQTATEAKPSDKELNFRKQEQMYQKQLEQERQARLDAEKKYQEAIARSQQQSNDDDVSDEPYVDHKRLDKKLNRFGESTKTDIQKAMEMAKQSAKEEIKQEMWLEQNPDFYDIMKLCDKFAEKNPKLADSILRMPESFDRQKLVYENIKSMGLDKPEQKQSSIQDKIDANRRSPYYQSPQMGTAPYAGAGDFSPAGKQNAYAKMQELKARLRI